MTSIARLSHRSRAWFAVVLVSWSGTDKISVISYKTGKLIADVPVGNHPQRVRMGYVRNSWIRAHG